MSTKLDVEPNTDAWLALRKNKIGASDAAAILNIGYLSPYQLWEQKLGFTKIEINHAMAEGIRLEPIARDYLIKEFGFDLQPAVYQHSSIEYMMASLDAYNAKEKCLIEIKCGPSSFFRAKGGEIPTYYFAQMQHQLEVMELDKMHYCCFYGQKSILFDVYRDTPYIKSLLEAEAKFWDCLENFIPPELTDTDYIKMFSDQWINTASEWIALNNKMEALKTKQEELRANLIRLAEGRNCMGAGIRVKKVISKGQINYDAIPELKQVNLENYRKEPTTSYRITKTR